MNIGELNRRIKNAVDMRDRMRETWVARIQASFNMNRLTAQKFFEITKIDGFNNLLGVMGGLFGLYLVRPLARMSEANSLFFKKPWAKIPGYGIVFIGAWYGITQIRARLFSGKQVGFERYTGNSDLVSQFRIFESHEPSPRWVEEKISDYLYENLPLSKNDLAEHAIMKVSEDFNIGDYYSIRQVSKDRDPIFWSYGKLHGLENIAFADENDLLKSKANPVTLQNIIDNSTPSHIGGNLAEFQANLHKSLDEYKQYISSMNLLDSDRKKLLALPFFLTRRAERPTPKIDQFQMKLFKELFKEEYYSEADLWDTEKKITEFDYENYFSPKALDRLPSSESPEFKKLIKISNYFTNSTAQRRDKMKSYYSNHLMPIMAMLNEEESRVLFHKLLNDSQNEENIQYDQIAFNKFIEKEMALKSEEANFRSKSRYGLEKRELDHIDKSRVNIEKQKFFDLMENNSEFQTKIEFESGTYNFMLYAQSFENALASLLINTAGGDIIDLLKDIGLKKEYVQFQKLSDIDATKEEAFLGPYDEGLKTFLNTVYTPIDMTEYETVFMDDMNFPMLGEGYRELMNTQNDAWPVNPSGSAGIVEDEPNNEFNGLSRSIFETISESKLDYDAMKEGLEDSENSGGDDDDDEDEDDEEEGDEGGEDDEGEEDDEEETEEEKEGSKMMLETAENGDKPFTLIPRPQFFRSHDKLRDKFNEFEVESFIKLLNISPLRNWKDDTTYHWRLGEHAYEDEGQELDPYYHVLNEEERKQMAEVVTREFRKGAAVYFRLGKDKRADRGKTRF